MHLETYIKHSKFIHILKQNHNQNEKIFKTKQLLKIMQQNLSAKGVENNFRFRCLFILEKKKNLKLHKLKSQLKNYKINSISPKKEEN